MKINRTDIIKVRVTKEEKKMMVEKAIQEGVPLSTHIRKSSLSQVMRSNVDIMLVFQLKKVGNNLNQLVHYINMIPADDNVNNLLISIDTLISDIKTIVEKIK